MARDYAKSRNPRGRPPRARKRSRFLWLFIGVMLGLLIPSFGYVKQHVTSLIQGKKLTKDGLLRDPLPQKLEKQQIERAAKKATTERRDEIEDLEEKVDFDFYTILSDSEKTAPPNTKNIEAAEQKLLTKASGKTQPASENDDPEDLDLPAPKIKAPATYILQLGSFKTFEEADQLKAQLSLNGLHAKIKQTTVNGITRHRVWTGVYTSLESAEKAQQKLAAENIQSALAQVK